MKNKRLIEKKKRDVQRKGEYAGEKVR